MSTSKLGVAVWPLGAFVLVAIYALTTYLAGQETQTYDLLRWHGYTEVMLLEGELNLPCDGRRKPRQRFTAHDRDGEHVRGYLCCHPEVGCEVEVVP